MSNQFIRRFREYVNANQFNAIKISIASSEKVLSLSYGEVKKIETINYRTLKPERDGLFCARIFGPVKDWECNCGKYKRMKHRGVTCEKCGVEVIQSRVRRERMGHIKLVAPVCHIWYLKGIPSYLGLIFDVPVKDLERVVYFDAYMVIAQGKSPYARKTVITAAEYDSYMEHNLDDSQFVALMGAEALATYLESINIESDIALLKLEYDKTTSVAARHKLMRRIKVMSGLHQAGIRPEWMIMSVLPVLPPDLRPLVPLDGGRFASSDLNELYRRVLNRNIRLQRLLEIEAPSVIIKNEKRMLQEAVDALIDNGRRGQPVRGSNKRPLKSLSEMLRGKQGRFRQNLLGKRVDYSARSVIVVDPELQIHQCGLPKIMALELFKSHVYAGLLQRELAPNLRAAKRMVEEQTPEVWDVLAEVVASETVLLNRAPTLHRLGIQGFKPVLVDGKSIKIHPLVCKAFNADFDGDQMAVHIPLSQKARQEADALILATRNVLSPASGKPIMVPSQDMVLGLHYMTKIRYHAKGEGIIFASVDEVISAWQHGGLDLHARIKVRLDEKRIVETTCGRIVLYRALPQGSDIEWVNKSMTTSDLSKMVERVYYRFGNQAAVDCLDKIKKLGFTHSTAAGVSFALSDLITPDKKDILIKKADKEVQKVEQMYLDGVITNGERYSKVVSIWFKATTDVANNMMANLVEQDKRAYENHDNANLPFNSIHLMLEAGAKGSRDQIKQLVGMRGLMSKPSGDIMETPVKSNFRDGLSVFEYFISTHGARKGQADTALKTANAGYLTRKLIDIAQDVIVVAADCYTMGYATLENLEDAGDVLYPVAARAFSRVLAEDVKDEVSGKLIFSKGHVVRRNDINALQDAAISKIAVRSVLTCQARRGVCALCYGLDMSKNEIVDIGTTVGIIAAQSIGEPGTQLTMRTFHIGGTASHSEHSSYTAKVAGKVVLADASIQKDRSGNYIIMNRNAKLSIVSEDGRELQRHDVEYGAQVFVADGDIVAANTKLAEWDPHNKVILADRVGTVRFVDLVDNVTVQERYDETTDRTTRMIIEHKGDRYQPAIAILDPEGEELVQYFVPTGAYIVVDSGQQVAIGDVVVKMPREISRNKDITGGLPKISELFEARLPKDPAVLSDIDGEVVIGGLHRGLRKVTVVNGAESFDYYIPRGKQLNVSNGDFIRAGESISQGIPVLHDILRIAGLEKLQKYLVDQIQEIYRRQGVDINDRHIELIVRQMSRKVRVIESGDTDFLVGDRVDRIHFKAVNEALLMEGKRPAIAKPVLQGITLASLGTESFISAASFQETTRILAEAAIFGTVDNLYGLKENVIIGKLIPAGTGIESFREKYLAGFSKGNSSSESV